MSKSICLFLSLFLCGVCILFYPFTANLYNTFHMNRLIRSYAFETEQEDDAVVSALFERATAYNASLFVEANRFLPSEEKHQDYLTQLKLENQQMIGYIIISRLGISLPVYLTTEEAVLSNGIGHLEGSSLPIGGTGIHTVLSGHSGMPSKELFTNLDQLQEGDTVELYILGEKLIYRMKEAFVILPDETDLLAIEEEKDLLSLITCTPIGVNSHRLLVRCERIPEDLSQENEFLLDLVQSELLILLTGIIFLGLIVKRLLYKMRSCQGLDS